MKRFMGVSAGAGMLGLLVFGAGGTVHARGGETVDQKFQAMDTNHDGQLSMDEFVAGHAKKFDKMDKNGDGKVTSAEMQAAKEAKAQEHGGEPANAEGMTADKMSKLDTNGDGAISKQEFEAGARDRFRAMDTDHDGHLTKSELEAGHAKMQKGSSSTPSTPGSPNTNTP